MAVATSRALARLRGEPLADCALAGRVEQLCRDHAYAWRDRLLTPAVTVRLMLLQVLHGNTAITQKMTQIAQIRLRQRTATEQWRHRFRARLEVLRHVTLRRIAADIPAPPPGEPPTSIRAARRARRGRAPGRAALETAPGRTRPSA